MLREGVVVSADLQSLHSVVENTNGGLVRHEPGRVTRSPHHSVGEKRIDPAHDSLTRCRPRSNRRGSHAGHAASIAPTRSPSFGSLLPSDASPMDTQAAIGLCEENRQNLCDTSVAYDVGVFHDSEVMDGVMDADCIKDVCLLPADCGDFATEKMASLKHSTRGRQPMTGDLHDHSGGYDGDGKIKECELGIGVGLQAEGWLSLHAADLIRRIQSWSEDLSERESQLMARIALQERRERRFRALCDTTVEQNEERTHQDR